MTPPLPAVFLSVPLAHRGLHDIDTLRPENSRAAVRAAIEAGYGIEIDLQLTADGQAMVFHDYDLSRLTGEQGPIRAITAETATQIALYRGDGEGIPTLTDILGAVQGKVPLLIEIKDQDGAMGPAVGALEAAAADALRGYAGPVAVMSFNPHSVAKMAELAPEIPRGLVTSGYDPSDWPLSAKACARLREIPDFETAHAAFISHDKSDLTRDRVQQMRAAGVPVLCWTIRTPAEEAEARKLADNVTFEGYLAPLPG